MVHPKISIALCTYNGEKYLTAQLDSILDQTHPADEIIIVDDGSTDATLDIIREYASRTDILQYFVNEQTLGYVRNFSKAISLTSGDFVALSDQDDIWTKDHIEKLLNNIGGKAVCVGDSIMIDAQGKETGERFSDIKQNYYIPENDVQKAYRIVFNYNPTSVPLRLAETE
ncbi:MAG: glycosyltransferase [Bacteroidales bacterium]|nr:glycosyltransferase [Bacteroidales bacterium]